MLTKKESKSIKHKIKRDVTTAEKTVTDALWSEHCSYKSSKKWFDLFNTEGPRVVLGAGEGLIDVGDGFVIKLGIDSSSHISALETYIGASTGVGSLISDLISQGCKPIALLDCLRFGNPSTAHQRELLDQVILGKTSFSNFVGVPNMGSNLAFSDEFDNNPLVNIMGVGVAKQKEIIPLIASNPDDLLVLYGTSTGLDIVSTVTSSDKDKQELKVQKGNPSTAKLLINATLKLKEMGLLNGLHDLARGGLACAALKMAERGKNGVTIDLLKIPLKSPEMTGSEILTSETQERMLATVDPQKIDQVLEVLSKYDFQTAVIGTVTEGNTFFAHKNESLETNLPVDFVVNEFPEQKRKVLRDRSKINYTKRITKSQDHPLIELLTSYNISCRTPLYKLKGKKEKSIISLGDDNGVIKLPNNKLLAIATGGNSYMISQDIKDGAALATLGVIRSVISRGAIPIGMIDSLNAGNPDKAGPYTEFVNVLKGVAEVSHKMNIPVVGGHVSFNNEVSGKEKDKFLTSAFIGVVGLIDKIKDLNPDTLKDEIGKIYLLGPDDGFLAGSEYYKRYGGDGGEITVDFEAELQAKELLSKLRPYISACVDIGRGGLLTTLAKWSIQSNIGLNYFYESEDLSFAWGEHGPRYLIQIPKDQEINCLMECDKFETELEITPIAQIIKEKKFELSDGNSWELTKLKEYWEGPFESKSDSK